MAIKKIRKKAKVMGHVDIRRVPVKLLKLAAYNPRVKLQPGMPAWESIKKSLETFSLVEPLVWNERTGNLVGGHQRLAIMVATLNVNEVDVSVVNLSLTSEKALSITLNNVQGEWDGGTLRTLLAELRSDANIDETVTGFDSDEFDRLLGEVRDLPMTEIETKKPPVMAWVLIGIETTKYGEISELVKSIATMPGVKCETTVNDG